MPAARPDTAPPLRRGLLVAFTLPTLVLGVMHGPEGQIQAIYAKHAGLSLGALAVAMLLTKLFDAVTYPLIGQLSDRSYARTGTRRSWLVAGTATSVVGVWFLLQPPPGVTVFYFGLWMTVTYLGWKVIEIPLQAWSFGLSADYAQRARVQGWRALAAVAGSLLFFLVPSLAVLLGASDSTELDFRSLGVAAVICVVALPLATAVLVLRVPGGARAPAPAAAQPRFRLRDTVDAVRDSPPLRRLIVAFLPVSLLTGMSTGVTYLYVDVYLGLSSQLPAIMIVTLLMSLVGIPVWAALAARYERHRVWACSLIAGGAALTLLALVPPGDSAVVACFVLYPAVTFSLAGLVVVSTMFADIVDHGRLHSGQDHAGLYGALFAFVQKSVLGVSAAIGVALVGVVGFDATASVQTAFAELGIKVVFGIAPAAGLVAAAVMIWNYPLNRRRIAEIQAALAERADTTGKAEPRG